MSPHARTVYNFDTNYITEGPKISSWCLNQNIWLHIIHLLSTWCTVYNLTAELCHANICNATPNALLHLTVLLTDFQKLFCFFASYSNLHHYDILFIGSSTSTLCAVMQNKEVAITAASVYPQSCFPSMHGIICTLEENLYM
jgi:hypothetical protein